ncbi:MAG: nucleotide exchange factor GrpE [Flavobacteriales bacterium Tduv]
MDKDQDKSQLGDEKKYFETEENYETCESNEEKPETDQLSEKLEEEKDRYVRLFAEFENYKKRVQKERLEFFKTAHEELVVSLLPILDDFERGLEEISQSEGMMLIREKLIKTLEEKGLKKSDTKKGNDFNTDFHEAITQIPAPTEDLKGKIVEVIEAGYLLGNKVIRHAKVVIGK